MVDDLYEDLVYGLTHLTYDDAPPIGSLPIGTPVDLPRNPLPEPNLGNAEHQEIVLWRGALLIESLVLLGAIVIASDGRWPYARFRVIAIITVLGGLAYTVFDEWLNTEIRGSWAYTKWMPTLPLTGSDLAPLAQWLLVPPLALWWARRGLSAIHNPDNEQ